MRGHHTHHSGVMQTPLYNEHLGPGYSGQFFPGDGMDRDMLEKAGIARSGGLAALTASDDINVVFACLSRRVDLTEL
jgi:trk system potassium uptake protein TrkA